MIVPKQAIVRPRVIVEYRESSILLEDLIEECIDSPHATEIQLFGMRASGVTTALEHAAFVYRDQPRIMFRDRDRSTLFASCTTPALIMIRSKSSDQSGSRIACSMALWDRDTWIEYLLAVDRDRIASVMKRVQNDLKIQALSCYPYMSRLVMDDMASDENVPNIAASINRITRRYFPDTLVCKSEDTVPWLKRVTGGQPGFDVCGQLKIDASLSVEQTRLVNVYDVQHLLLVDTAWHDLRHETEVGAFYEMWPVDVIQSLGKKIQADQFVQQRLLTWLESAHVRIQPLVVSLLHAAGIHWELPRDRWFSEGQYCGNLRKAALSEGDFTDKSFANHVINGASFDDSMMEGVSLRGASANGASFVGTDLRNTDFSRFQGLEADFSGANLSGCHGSVANFRAANFSRADLSETRLINCVFCQADLSDANLAGAILCHCDLTSSKINDADFGHAVFIFANLSSMDLTIANFRNAVFRDAMLKRAYLEGIELPDADFQRACLDQAILTASVMPRANLSAASLRLAKLAEVEWESVDLSNADLTGATFHMGSSRSGLIDSSTPMLGSRTGFYTDELNEQDFKSPEEIRKANLRGADLRGARIDGVDFYLVDLRDARYDDDQETQLIRTGAILQNRVL